MAGAEEHSDKEVEEDHGHEDARFLDWGFGAWEASGLPTMQKEEEVEQPSSLGRPAKRITPERPKIDRIARPWLIRRFVDPLAESSTTFSPARPSTADSTPGAARSPTTPPASAPPTAARRASSAARSWRSPPPQTAPPALGAAGLVVPASAAGRAVAEVADDGAGDAAEGVERGGGAGVERAGGEEVEVREGGEE